MLTRFWILFFIIWTGSAIGSNISNAIKRYSSFLTSSTEEVEDSNLIVVGKRMRFSVPDRITYLESFLDEDKDDLFIQQLGQDCSVLDPASSNIFEKLFAYNKWRLIGHIFNEACPDNFDLFLAALKSASSLFKVRLCRVPTMLYLLLKSPKNQSELLNYLLTLKDGFTCIETFLRKGITFGQWRNKNGQNIMHVLVNSDKTDLVPLCDANLLAVPSRTRMTPIFYAKSAKMVKMLRRMWPCLRQAVDFQGRTAWQAALQEKNFPVVNAMISFSARLKAFRAQFLNYFDLPWVKSASLLKINRNNLFKESYELTRKIKTKWFTPKHKFFIKFIDEVGLDAGGLKLDWLTSLLNCFFVGSADHQSSSSSNTFTAPLFIQVDSAMGLYAPNASEYPVDVFRFAGSIFGLATAMRVPLKAKMIPAFYRFLMGEEIDLVQDLKEQSPSIHRSLECLHDPEINFSELDLKLLSRSTTPVTRRNVQKYIDEFSRDALEGRYLKQLKAIRAGFESVLTHKPTNYLISSKELMTVLTGMSVDYTGQEFLQGCISRERRYHHFLREIIDEMTQVQRLLLLKFITGMESLPFNGFAGLSQKIQLVIGLNLYGKLPTSSTCTFTLFLPPSLRKESLKRALITAIEMTGETDFEGSLTEADGIVLGFDDEIESNESESDSVRNDEESDVSADEISDPEMDEIIFISSTTHS
jgi:hypothetical protein